MIKRRANGYHNWRACTSTSSRILSRDEFTRIGVYRDGVNRLRCNRCFRLIIKRETDDSPRSVIGD
jgi:hypothetical protein